MLILGEWYPCADHVERPVICGEVVGANGRLVRVNFLVDSGADRTVFSADIVARLRLEPVGTGQRLGGLGGSTQAITIETTIRLMREPAGVATFPGRYSALTALETLDMSVLGRDVLDRFALIVDRPGDTVCLINQRHQYGIRMI